MDLTGQSLGRYHIIEPLGTGGMATVYKGYDTLLERNIAIKVIRASPADDGSFLKRFQREAKALAQLDHPYILKVLDYGEQNGVPYLVMPFVSGGTLKNKLGQPIPFREAAALLAPIARALEYAHQMGIIHRDLKPANILMTQSGEPILSDFGIAKMLDKEEGEQLTGTGVGIGTPDYMAPEQWMGEVDNRTDIYSLGVVFFEMVTGRRPFEADTPAAVLIKHVQDPLPRPSSIVPRLPEAVEHLLYKALEKKPKDRFQNMAEMAAAFETLATIPRSADSQPVKKPEVKKANWKTGSILLLGLGAAAVVFCLILVAVFIFSRPAAPTPPVRTPVVRQVTAAPIQTTSAASTLTPQAPQAKVTLPPIKTIQGFPIDIPIIPQNNGDLKTTSTVNQNTYTFTSSLPFQKVMDYYEINMGQKGWKEIFTTEVKGEKSTWIFQKEETRKVTIEITRQETNVLINIILLNPL